MRRLVNWMVRITLFAVFAIIVACTLMGCRQRRTFVVVSDSAVAVGPDWVEFPLPKPLRADWQYQIVQVTVASKFQASTNPLGLRLEDGRLSIPEIDAATDAGVHQALHLSGFPTANQVEFAEYRVPRGTQFAHLRMRSPLPLSISRVVWISYMPQDTKTGSP